MKYHRQNQSGLSLVEVIIVAAVSTLVFGALLLSFKYSLELMNISRAKLSALSVANDRMEFFRSLPYADVGVVSGFPAGTIPETSTITLNNIDFAERVLVDYVDDPGDDVAGVDGNSITTDYKKIKVEYTWEINGNIDTIFLVSNIVPRSIETDVGGGTVRVNVIDQDSNLLPDARVTLTNSTIGPIDVTRFTGITGSATFAAPAGGDYELLVTANIGGNDYSTAQTYQPTVSVPNPVVSPFAVLEADISTLTFQIDELSDLSLTSYSAIDDNFIREEFSDLTGIAASTDVAASGGNLVLANTAGVYQNSGIAYVGPISPVTLSEWHSARVAIELPANTSHFVQFFTGVAPGPFMIIPDGDLPGNSVGFTENIIDLTELNSTIYPNIFAGVTIETTDTSVTPEVDEFSIFYNESKTVLSNAGFDIRGNKIVGTESDSSPVYKFTDSLSTDGSGEISLTDMEFDQYQIDFSGYDIATACDGHPILHRGGEDSNVLMEVVSDSTHRLRVVVTNTVGENLPGAEVDLSRPGYSGSETTNNCGQVFFSGVANESDYSLDISATGYDTENLTAISIDGYTLINVSLSE